MSEINPGNYDGANITIVGRAAGPYAVKEFGNGSSIAELSIAVGKGYKKDGEWVDLGTDWYVLTSTPDYAATNWPPVGKGDRVRVDDGRFETKSFDRKDGSHDKSLNVRYGTLTIIEKKDGAPVREAAPADAFATADMPW